jgi:hypothetical protein
MTFTEPFNPTPQRTQTEEPSVLWMDQLTQELLLTVQAFQRLQTALQEKMIGG